MVLRRDARGVLAVGQASHAWMCGQFARAWGNVRFGAILPLEEVALGAEQHDIGMAEWDLRPQRHPETGLPRSFIEMELPVVLEMWRRGPARLSSQSRYAGLLAARHGRRLYERRDLEGAPPKDAEMIRAYLADARALEQRLLAALRADPMAAPCAEDAQVARNSQLVWTWDTLSLALLLDWAPLTLHEVPAAGDSLEVAVRPAGAGAIVLDPWPLREERPVVVHCDGRRLDRDRYESDAALQAALDAAPWETASFELRPPG